MRLARWRADCQRVAQYTQSDRLVNRKFGADSRPAHAPARRVNASFLSASENPVANRLCSAAMTPSDSLDQLVRDACQGSATALERHFVKRGGLPGSRPNYALARDAASALLAQGAAGQRYLMHLARLDENAAPDDTAHEFLVLVGVIGLGLQAARSPQPLSSCESLHSLQQYVEDRRRHVRHAVHVALADVLTHRGDEAVEAFASWTDGYLQAEAVLRAMTSPDAERGIRASDAMIARFDEAFDLLEKAPRSHERSHGYRALLRAIAEASPKVGKRFAPQFSEWLEAKAATRVPALRNAIRQATSKLRRAGGRAGDLDAVRRALERSEPAPRDPRTMVGPTRKRGKR